MYVYVYAYFIHTSLWNMKKWKQKFQFHLSLEINETLLDISKNIYVELGTDGATGPRFVWP